MESITGSDLIPRMRSVIPLFLILCLASATPCFASEETIQSQIRQWVQQLGDPNFLVRQRAESLLIQAGIQAYPELRRAKQSHDIEIVRRAEYILNQIEQVFLNMENQIVANWIKGYMIASDPITKARIIWGLADPATVPNFETNLDRGEGLQTLCRLVRFEENNTLRHEAAKSLIASPPISRKFQQKWYRYIQEDFLEPGDDELLQCLAHYAKLWCDLNDTDTKKTPAFQDRVRQIGAETLRLLEKPENSVQVGGKMNILLHYAVVELQDAAGLTEDRDKTIALALALQSEPLPDGNEPIGWMEEYEMFEHWYVGWWLHHRFRLHWALPHYRKVIETGHPFLRFQASNEAAEIAIFLADYAAAAAFFDKTVEMLESAEYKEQYSNSALEIVRAQRQKAYCLGLIAADEEDWVKVREILIKAWAIPNPKPADIKNMDLVILSHRFSKQHPDDNEFRNRYEHELRQVWQAIMDNYGNIPELIPNICNSAAWLLVNTDGDYSVASTFIEVALKAEPDNVHYLDTQAYVHFLGGKFEEAVNVQERVVRMVPEAVIFRQALERFKKQ